jgi:hypothetical protein
MFSRDIEAYRKGDRQKRHFILMKWGFLCVGVAVLGFFLELFLHWPIGGDLATVAILANFGLVFAGLRNFWSGR